MKGEESPDLLIERLGLAAHPEGGFFKETFRSTAVISLPDGRVRAASTAIYYLLPSGTFSSWHRVSSDEVWHFYGGAPLKLLTIDGEGRLETIILGHDISAGELPQHVVRAGFWQGAKPMGSGSSLLGCTVAPGFDFEDFEMPVRAELEKLFPQHLDAISDLA